jgi:pimeloyl-ACP methyl ester carboxylesterase
VNIVVGGVLINYLDEGQGPLIVMMHGWGSNLRVYDNMTAELTKKHRVVRFDWPGFGSSQKPPQAWGVEEFAAIATGFLNKLSLKPKLLVGHSMGGQIAVNMVGRGLVKPQKLVLLAASAVRPPVGPRQRIFMAAAKIGKRVVPARLQSKARQKLYQAAGTTDYLQVRSMQPSYQLITREDQQAWARKIHTPTLLIWGDQDDDAPLRRGRMLQLCILNSRLEVFPGAGHFMFVEQPQGTLQLIEDFIDA